METIYDMDMRFVLLADQFNKKLAAQETKFIDRIKQLEETNLKLARANLELDSKFTNQLNEFNLFRSKYQRTVEFTEDLERKFTQWIKELGSADFKLTNKLEQLESSTEEQKSKLTNELKQLKSNTELQQAKLTNQLDEFKVKYQRTVEFTEDLESKLFSQTRQLKEMNNGLETKLTNQIVQVKQDIEDKNPLVLIGFERPVGRDASGFVPIFSTKKCFNLDYHIHNTTIILESLLAFDIKELNLPQRFKFTFYDEINSKFSIGDSNYINWLQVKKIFEFCDKHNINVLLDGSDQYQGKSLRDWIAK